MTRFQRNWWLTGLVSALLILGAAFWADAARSVEATPTPAYRLPAGAVVTDVTKAGVHYEVVGRGDLCPGTDAPHDVLRGVIGLKYHRNFYDYEYGPWNASFCSTATRITYEDFNRPGYSEGDNWFHWQGDSVVSQDHTGDVREVIRKAHFAAVFLGPPASVKHEHPKLKVKFVAGEPVITNAWCGDC